MPGHEAWEDDLTPFEGTAKGDARSPFGRLLVASFAFAALLVGGSVWLYKSAPHRDPKHSNNKALSAGSNDDDEAGFFYHTVGGGPQLGVPRSDAFDAANGERDAGNGTSSEAKVSYTLEFKMTTSREEAEHLIDKLHEQGIEAYYTPLSHRGKILYRVRRGMFPSMREADRAAVAIRTEHEVNAKVVKLQ